MATVTCVGKYRDKQDRIYGYKLMDKNGQYKDVKPDSLKKAIAKKRIVVSNLTLTADGRLVDTGKKKIESIHLWGNPSPFAIHRIYGFKASYDTDDMTVKTVTRGQPAPQVKNTASKGYAELTPKLIQSINKPKHLRFKSNVNIIDSINKATTRGFDFDILDLDFAILENNSYIYLISNKQILLGNSDHSRDDDDAYLLSTYFGDDTLFGNTVFKSIRFNGVDASKSHTLDRMFYECEAKYIDLSGLDMSNVIDMHNMFCQCHADVIDISSLKTDKVTNMCHMFSCCHARIIGLNELNTSNVEYMQSMFHNYGGKSLNLSCFDTSKVKNMCRMFHCCEVKNLDLSSFTATSVKDISEMFVYCEAERIDLRNFSLAGKTNVNVNDTFTGCNARVTARDDTLLKAVINAKNYVEEY